ncbi:hypothetical protein C6A40_03225 [Enterobacter sp. GER_MD16_1505_Eko_090]|jgi:hypothetical protein|nr:hypothetical protein B1H21_19990 [Enterobacter roggenkampii]POT98745.1 hypothetical protein C3399_07000 [Enterobacter cloacae complex sp. ECNIH14]RCL27165.1 hypothetical protein C6A40_03225 [Enterobacter sp. GER_MD16_1505_Eko_090]
MPSIPSFVNGFVQISAVNVATLRYVVMAQDSTSLLSVNTAFRHKNRSSRADFFAAKGQPDEIITAFCFARTIAG